MGNRLFKSEQRGIFVYNQRLLELKNSRKLTNQQISDLSGVPLSTVTRIMSGQSEGNFQTICDIVKALDGSLDDIVGIKKPSTEERTNPLIELYQNTLNEKNKWIKTLFFCLCGIVCVILFILIYDITNGNIGYVRY